MDNSSESLDILKILSFFGLVASNNHTIKKHRSRFRLRTWILLLITHGYIIHCSAYSLTFALKTGQLSSFFLNFIYFTESFVTVFTLDYFLYKKNSIWHCVNQILNFPSCSDLLTSYKLKKTRQKHLISKAIMLLLVFLVLVLRTWYCYWYIFKNLHVKEYIDIYWYGFTCLTRYEWIGTIVAFLDMTVYLVATAPSYLAYIAMAAVGHDMNRKLRDFTSLVQSWKSGSREMTAKSSHVDVKSKVLTILKICQLHTETLNLVRSFNDMFGFLFLVWLNVWLIDFFTGVPVLIESFWRHNYWEILYYGVSRIITFILSLLVSFALADVETNHSELERTVHCRVHNIKARNQRELTEIRYLVRKISSSRVVTRIAVFKFFPVTKTLVCQLYFTVTTFVIFVVQELAKGSF